MSITADHLTNIQASVTSSDSVYYAIGGTLLVVLAGILGFKKIDLLLGDRAYEKEAAEERRRFNAQFSNSSSSSYRDSPRHWMKYKSKFK